MFSFRGRIARLPFFLSCLALAASCILPAIVAIGLLEPIRAGNKIALWLLIALLVLFVIIIFWIGLALQVRRIRDMGWRPLIVLPGWLALQFADVLVARFFPVYGIGATHSQTMLGVAVNLFFTLALTFWPSTDDDVQDFTPKRVRISPAEPVPTAPVVETRAAIVPRTSFGRR